MSRQPKETDARNRGVSVEVINAHPTSRLRRDQFVVDVGRVLSFGDVQSAEVRVIFVDEGELLSLNRDFLGHDYHTDVITFPIEHDPLEGEVYISVEMIRSQASERNIPFYEEARRLAIHGALHLVGYDDATDLEREEMRRLEDRFLALH